MRGLVSRRTISTPTQRRYVVDNVRGFCMKTSNFETERLYRILFHVVFSGTRQP